MAQAPQSVREKRALAIAREQLARLEPGTIAHRAGVRYEPGGITEGVFWVPFLGTTYRVTYPAGVVESGQVSGPVKHATCLLLLHYLVHADGHRMADKWVTFRELPDGLIYDGAFRGRVEPPLLTAFAQDLQSFARAARALGGSPIAFGDAAFQFGILPRIRMAVVFYLGDEELPPAVTVLYDAAAGHYLPTEDLAILGGMLVGALLRHARH